MNRSGLLALSVLCVVCVVSPSAFVARAAQAPAFFNVRDYGAVGDGKTLDTDAINNAMEACHAAGGGTVLLPAGQYRSGKIHLKSNVTLHISNGATLLAAPGPIYGEPGGSINALIWGDQLENVAITGGGTIEGKTGLTREREPEGVGRRAIGLQRCKNVKITDLTIRNGGGCTMLLLSVDGLQIGNVKVESFFDRSPEGGYGKDGVNLDGCRNVYVHDCDIRGSDDAFAFKCRQSGFKTVTENVRIERCTFASRTSNALQFGSETNNDFRKIDISDITIQHAGKAGIGITMNDGSTIENVSYSNVIMRNVCTPIFILITDRHGAGRIRNVRFTNITATDIAANPEYSQRSPKGWWASAISGMAGHPVKRVVFRDVKLTYRGGGTREDAEVVPPDPAPDYQPRKLGMRPAAGFYLRHAKGIEFHNVMIADEEPDMRPAIVADDVEGLLVEASKLPRAEGVDCDILARGSRGVQVRNADLVVKEAPLPAFAKPVNEEQDEDEGEIRLSQVPDVTAGPHGTITVPWNKYEAPPAPRVKPSAKPRSSLEPYRVQRPSFPDRTVNVHDFGAKGDGKSLDSEAVNKAIQSCAAAEGTGTFLQLVGDSNRDVVMTGNRLGKAARERETAAGGPSSATEDDEQAVSLSDVPDAVREPRAEGRSRVGGPFLARCL